MFSAAKISSAGRTSTPFPAFAHFKVGKSLFVFLFLPLIYGTCRFVVQKLTVIFPFHRRTHADKRPPDGRYREIGSGKGRPAFGGGFSAIRVVDTAWLLWAQFSSRSMGGTGLHPSGSLVVRADLGQAKGKLL